MRVLVILALLASRVALAQQTPAVLLEAAQAAESDGDRAHALELYAAYVNATNDPDVRHRLFQLDEGTAPAIAKRPALVLRPPTPVYKKAWFWGIVAGVVVVGATTAVLVTQLSSSSSSPQQPAMDSAGLRIRW